MGTEFVKKLNSYWESKFKSKRFHENEEMYAIQIQEVFCLLCDINNYSIHNSKALDYSDIFEKFDKIFEIYLNKNGENLRNIHLNYKNETKSCKKLFRDEIAKLTRLNLNDKEYNEKRKMIVNSIIINLREKFDRIPEKNNDISNEYENQLIKEINSNINSDQDLNDLCVEYLFKKLEKKLEKEILLGENDPDNSNKLELSAIELIKNLKFDKILTGSNWQDIQQQALKFAEVFFKNKFSKSDNNMSNLNYQNTWFFRQLYEDFITETINKGNELLKQDQFTVDRCAENITQNITKSFINSSDIETVRQIKLVMLSKLKEKWPNLKEIIQLLIDFKIMLTKNVVNFDSNQIQKQNFIDLNCKWVIEKVKYFNPLEFCICFKFASKIFLAIIENPSVFKQEISHKIKKTEELYCKTEGKCQSNDKDQDLLKSFKDLISTMKIEKTLTETNAKYLIQTIINKMVNEDTSNKNIKLDVNDMKLKTIEELEIYLAGLKVFYKIDTNCSQTPQIENENKLQIEVDDKLDSTFVVLNSSDVEQEQNIFGNNSNRYTHIQNTIYATNSVRNSRQCSLTNIEESSLETDKINPNIFISINCKNYLIFFFDETTNQTKTESFAIWKVFAKLLSETQNDKLVPLIKYSFDFVNLCGKSNLTEKDISNYPLKLSEDGNLYLKFGRQTLIGRNHFLIETILSMPIYYCINEMSKVTQKLLHKSVVILLPHNSTITKKNCIRSIRYIINLNSIGFLSEISATALAYYFDFKEKVKDGQNIVIFYFTEEQLEVVFAQIQNDCLKIFSGSNYFPLKAQSRWTFNNNNIVDEIEVTIKRENTGKSFNTFILSGQSEKKNELMSKIRKKFPNKLTVKDYSTKTILSAAQSYLQQMKSIQIFEIMKTNFKYQIGWSTEFELLFEGIESLPINSIVDSKTINFTVQNHIFEIKIFEQDEIIKIFKLKNLTEQQINVNLKVVFKFNTFSKILIELHFEDYEKQNLFSITEKEYSPKQQIISNEQAKLSKLLAYLN